MSKALLVYSLCRYAEDIEQLSRECDAEVEVLMSSLRDTKMVLANSEELLEVSNWPGREAHSLLSSQRCWARGGASWSAPSVWRRCGHPRGSGSAATATPCVVPVGANPR